MEDEVNGDLTKMTINRQVSDILRITGQNEVIQSFVRSELTHDPEENVHESKSASKKIVSVGRKANNEPPNTNIEKKETKEDLNVKNVQLYQQLGQDAQVIPKETSKGGNKWNRRQRVIEEIYTDKDRAAAVNLGSRDIKQSLKLKRRQDRTRILEISEEAHPGTLLTLAIHRFKNGDLYGALKFVNKALELNPFDKNALVARSRCHLFMGNASAALEDAENALRGDKSFIKGIYQKAEALYHLAQFEYSLMYFHRGLHIRPQMEDFKQGVFKAQQAILNTIGTTVPSFQRISLDRKKRSEENLVKEIISVSPEDKSGKLQDTKLLKELQADKVYLEKLMRNPDVVNANYQEKTENKILSEAKDGMKFLEGRQDFWRQQKSLVPKRTGNFPEKKLVKNNLRMKSQKKNKNEL